VLLFDDAGDHPALQAAEVIGRSGARVEVMTPDRTFAPEVMAMNLVPYMRSLQKMDVHFTVTWRLESVERAGDGLLAIVGSDYGGVRQERWVDQVVVNHGTRPLDDLYVALQPHSTNGGAVDYPAMLAGQAAVAPRSAGTVTPAVAAGSAARADPAAMVAPGALFSAGAAMQAPVAAAATVAMPVAAAPDTPSSRIPTAVSVAVVALAEPAVWADRQAPRVSPDCCSPSSRAAHREAQA
jgi:hypothetical protein